MLNKRQALLAVFAAITLASAMGTAMSSRGDSAQYTIRLSFLGSPEDEDHDGALVFKEYVESRSNGRAHVAVYPSGQFCSNERECIEGLQTGVLQVYMFTTGVLGGIFGPGQVLDLPYTFRDDAIAECVLDGPIIDEIRSAVLAADLKIRLMAVGNTGGWRNFASTKSEIRTPADIKGRKIRTIAAPVQQELVRQLGGNPTPVAWSEVYTALATGVVEGSKNGIQDIVGMKLHEQIKFITLDGHSYMGAMWWYSEPSWQALPEDMQRIVYDGFQVLKTVTRGIIKRREIEAYKEFRAAGGAIYVPSPEQKSMFREATTGVREWYSKTYGDKWLVKLDQAVAACEAQVDANYRNASKN